MRVTSHIATPEIPLLSDVKVADNLSIEVTWRIGSRAPRTEKVDLAPLINSLKVFKPLRENRALFETVHLLDDMGDTIAWGDDDTIDMDSWTIERLAEDMMTASAFKAFLYDMDYTHNTAAAMLGYSRRQIEYYISGFTEVPRVCALACAALRLRNPSAPSKLHHLVWINNWSQRDAFASYYGQSTFSSTSQWNIGKAPFVRVLENRTLVNQAAAGYDE